MSTADDDWREFAKRLNICAVCMNSAHPPDESGKRNFVPCRNCGTMLLFDSFGSLNYSVPKTIEQYLNKNRVFATIPKNLLELLPESVARENFAIPIAIRDEILIVGMLHPLLDILDKIRFVLNRNVLAVRITDGDFERLVRSYGKPV